MEAGQVRLVWGREKVILAPKALLLAEDLGRERGTLMRGIEF